MKIYKGVNWNRPENDYVEAFFKMLTSAFWLPEEINLNQDLNIWQQLPEEVKLAYSHNLSVLTFFDTHQGNQGMNTLLDSYDEKDEQIRSTLSFISMMENIHSKSYSSIFVTLLTPQQTDEVFAWAENNESLQKLLNIVIGNYRKLARMNSCKEFGFEEVSDLDYRIQKWKTMVTSVFLESWLFYTGFYYPLWFGGQGKLVGSCEIINLILRDESIHGLFIGLLSKEIWNTFDEELKEELTKWRVDLIEQIYSIQCNLIEELYSEVGLTHDVKIFMRYNCNKALMNLGFDPYWPEEEVNAIVLNGLNTETKTHDLFSTKGNGYNKISVEELKSDDFDF